MADYDTREADSMGLDTESSGVEESEQESEEEEPPPPMWADSGSEGEDTPNKKRRPAAKKKSASSSSSAGSGSNKNASVKSDRGTSSSKPPAAAASSTAKVAGKKAASEPPLWTAFAKYRSRGDVDRLGVTELKQWERYEQAGTVPPTFIAWYENEVRGSRSVPQALKVPGVARGFPEFCLWVADGHHKAANLTVRAGFEAMASKHAVVAVSMADRGGNARAPAAASSPPSSSRRLSPVVESTAVAGGGGTDTKARKRERRARKGVSGANGIVFAEKMQSALAGLESIDEANDDLDSKKAGGRAFQAGARAEDEVRRGMRQELAAEDANGDVLGAAFADSMLPEGTLFMLSALKRARAHKQRSDREFHLVEVEMEKCLGRLARMEMQYRTLVSETSGRECSMKADLARALPLVTEAGKLVSAGKPVPALDVYGNAIKLLEIHVDQSPDGESADLVRARDLLGVSLCNRSVCNLLVGNAYNGKEDAERAAKIWPCETSRGALEQSKLISQATTVKPADCPPLSVYPIPP